MKLSKPSQILMSFFLKKKCVDPVHQTKKTDDILLQLYDDIRKADLYISSIKLRPIIEINKIQTMNQIPKPEKFPSNSFPKEVREHINDNSMVDIKYSFSLFERNINFHFVVEDSNAALNIERYDEYAKMMLTWMHILTQYASRTCAKTLTVYLYFTRLLKNLPDMNIHVLSEEHINTAFTTTCPSVSEIIIFRQEEWFKVFMHETFHNFALDFSDMNNGECHATIKRIFPVNSEVNLFEAYAEFWAEIMNVCFCSYIEMKDKTDVASFLSHCEALINFERTYGFFQMVKTLGFMGLKYKNIYAKTETDVIARENLYKENTNVLSYYVIRLILLAHYQDFLQWCNIHNTSLLQFKKTIQNQRDFCDFIEKKYKTKDFLEGVKCAEKFMKKIRQENPNVFLMRNLRMSICELG